VHRAHVRLAVVVAVVIASIACGRGSESPSGEPTTTKTTSVVVGSDIVAAVATAALGEDAVVEVVPGRDDVDRAVLARLAPIPFGEGPQWATSPAPAADRPQIGSPDPAFWLDPDRVVQAARLIAADVALSPEARRRADTRIDDLAAAMRGADERVQALLAPTTPGPLRVTTDNVRLGYFAERYGLVVVPTTGADPLAGLDVDRLGPSGSPTSTLDGLVIEVARRIAAPAT
jgi:ABC-type Zn uptake system ZnuABC Zn-binding protein ZnuA